MIIGLSGYARSGKDATAKAMTGFTRQAFADPIRKALYMLNSPITANITVADIVDEFGWDIAKVRFPEIRRQMQILGKEIGREMFGQNVWVDIALKGVLPSSNIVFTDVRFHNEAYAIKGLGGQIWRINRPGTEPVNAHPSETAMDDWAFDEVITNDGSLDQLHEKISDLVPAQIQD
jgi:hypothetical protein